MFISLTTGLNDIQIINTSNILQIYNTNHGCCLVLREGNKNEQNTLIVNEAFFDIMDALHQANLLIEKVGE